MSADPAADGRPPRSGASRQAVAETGQGPAASALGRGPSPAGSAGSRPGRMEQSLARLVRGLARRWQWPFLLVLALFTSLPVAAPLLAMAGYERPAGAIYLLYRASCHQLPHHSWFLGGERSHYDWDEVQPYTDFGPGEARWAFHHPLREPELGYQLAFCQRDLAIWLSLLAACLWLAWRGRRRPPRPLPMRLYLLALLPIAIDGLTQLVGLRESTPLLRTATGALFGIATAHLVYPLLDQGFRELLALPASPPAGPSGGET